MLKIKKHIKHEQCQALYVRHGFYFVLLSLYFLQLQSCQKKTWDPNQQFENEVNKIIEQREVSRFLEENTAKENLSELNRKLRNSIRPGLEISSFNHLIGTTGQIIAKRNEGNTVWVTVKYYWKDIVAYEFDFDSSEYKFCSKTKPYLEVVANDIRIVSISWL
jgi:hypothetical protein